MFDFHDVKVLCNWELS